MLVLHCTQIIKMVSISDRYLKKITRVFASPTLKASVTKSVVRHSSFHTNLGLPTLWILCLPHWLILVNLKCTPFVTDLPMSTYNPQQQPCERILRSLAWAIDALSRPFVFETSKIPLVSITYFSSILSASLILDRDENLPHSYISYCCLYHSMTVPPMHVPVSLSLIKTCTRSARDQFTLPLKEIYLINYQCLPTISVASLVQ